MRVVIVNPPNQPFASSGILIEPIDAIWIASYLIQNGHDALVLDMDVKKLMPADFLNAIQGNFDAVLILYDYHIPLHDETVSTRILEIAAQAKSANARVMIAGKLATYQPSLFLFPNSNVDVLIAHEIELSLKELLSLPQWNTNLLSKIKGISYLDDDKKIHTTGVSSQKTDLDALPIPDRNLVSLKDYIDVRTLLSSRGCAMKCHFCHVPNFWGPWRSRKANLIVDEIESLIKQHAAKKILFLDDNAMTDQNRMKEICLGIMDRELKATFGCLSSLTFFDDSTFTLMYQAGFRWIHYGTESGDDRILEKNDKKISRNDIRDIISRTKQMGYRIRSSWILDLPEATKKSLDQTLELILETQTHEIRLHYLALRMGSRIQKEHPHSSTTQYIHQKSQNINLTAVDADKIGVMQNELIHTLEKQGYTFVQNSDECIHVDALKNRSPELKIVSLCPLRYGMGWEL